MRLLASAWTAQDADSPQAVVRHLRSWPARGVNGIYYFGEDKNTPELFPDTTADLAVGQAHMVYQLQGNKQVPISPSPFGNISDFVVPEWSAR